MNPSFWKNKRVLITGHTGFKGTWMSIWLNKMGSDVIGYSNSLPSEPCLYKITGIDSEITPITADIRDLKQLQNAILSHEPEIIIHMAAQSLVGNSYTDPIETYSTNVMGTVNLFEAVRNSDRNFVILNVTSDKCYENKESTDGYIETDELGGYDPYSNSKACSELVTMSFRNSFFNVDSNKKLASARAGNIIGGGDWSSNRLIPDIIRHYSKQSPLIIRNLDAVRPWQHVLDPLDGYLTLIENMWNNSEFSEAWNFGPDSRNLKTVNWILEKISEYWGVPIEWNTVDDSFHETNVLTLNCSKAKSKLNWMPKLDIQNSIKWTVDWYKSFLRNDEMKKFTEKQIDDYMLM